MTEPARYVMVGGFLGAGKTTAVAALARWLTARGLKVGLITNDQSSGLVDTAILRKRGFSVEEIAGGCFCCRFHSLSEAVEKLTDETRPDVFVAEPVGSCTDLVATVSYPLRRLYGPRYRVAPLSVLVDPQRAARILGLSEGRSFSAKVVYVYEKQLEEADLIVVNKTDLLRDAERARLVEALARRFPAAEVLCASAKEGEGLEPWFERLLAGDGARRPTMELDYDAYAEGEARLGWLNATVELRAPAPFDANALLLDLVRAVGARLDAAGLEIAHLKATLDARADGQLAVVSVVSSGAEPDVRESLLDAVSGGSLVVNLRAEGAPEALRSAADEALAAVAGARPGLAFEVEHAEHFRPAYPRPEHREEVPA